MSFVFKFPQLRLIASLAIIISTLFSALSMADEQSDRPFVVGVVSSKPVKAFERAMPLANYLATNLSQYGYSKGDVKVARNLRELERWLERGQVDIFSETAFTAYELESSNLADILARHWKNGSAEYHSLFFARSDSNISSFDDLVDKIVTFEDRLSTSAYYLPATTLLYQGYRLSEVSSPRETPPKGTIGYFFADELSPHGDESSMMSWVEKGIVAASAFSNEDWDDEVTPEISANLNVFYRTPNIPRAVMMARSTLDPQLKQDIQTLLFSADSNEEGLKALKAFKKTKKFDPIPQEALNTIHEIGAKRTVLED